MKKLLPYLISGKCLGTIFLLVMSLFLSISYSFAEDVLLGQYEFTTGANQDKATNVVSGLTFSGALDYTNATYITAVYQNDAVVTTGWIANSQNIGRGQCIQFTINKDVTLEQFKVSSIKIYYKRGGADANQKNTLSVSPSLNDGATLKIWSALVVPYVGPDFEILNIESANFPTVTDNNLRYFSFAPQASNPFTIDKIEVWGTYAEATNPAITTDITSKTITASHLHPYTFPMKISGLYLNQTTTLSLTGVDNAYFEVDKSSLTAGELNGQEVTVNVTYDASLLTYDPVTKTNTPHLAVLQIANPDITAIEIPITATSYVLFEDFSNYNNTTSAGSDLSLLPVIPGNNILTLTPNWTGANLYEFRGSSALGCICLGSTETDSAFLITRELDLSQPFELQFKMRSLVNPSDGRIWVYVDNDSLIQTAVQTNSSMNLKISNASIGTANSKLKFTGIQLANNQIIIDDITVNYTSSPALNVYLNQRSDFGKVSPLGNKTVNIPLKGYNLTGDVSLSFQDGTNFSVTSGTTIAQATATAGTSIDVQFAAPAVTGEYNDVLTVTTSGISRTINLVATSDTGTGTNTANKGKVSIYRNAVELSGFEGAHLEVFTVTGLKVFDNKQIRNNEFIELSQKGCYILKIDDGKASISEKVIIR
ncbi:MAG: T9SS type A sorting domain-containing protein [Paludibacter sp.]|nr:T9SS type A sorting domain-containing protein [Paludibacter sp.]